MLIRIRLSSLTFPTHLTWSFVFCAAVIIVIKPLEALEFPLLWLTHQAQSDEYAPHECELIIPGFTHAVNINIQWEYLGSIPLVNTKENYSWFAGLLRLFGSVHFAVGDCKDYNYIYTALLLIWAQVCSPHLTFTAGTGFAVQTFSFTLLMSLQ